MELAVKALRRRLYLDHAKYTLPPAIAVLALMLAAFFAIAFSSPPARGRFCDSLPEQCKIIVNR